MSHNGDHAFAPGSGAAQAMQAFKDQMEERAKQYEEAERTGDYSFLVPDERVLYSFNEPGEDGLLPYLDFLLAPGPLQNADLIEEYVENLEDGDMGIISAKVEEDEENLYLYYAVETVDSPSITQPGDRGDCPGCLRETRLEVTYNRGEINNFTERFGFSSAPYDIITDVINGVAEAITTSGIKSRYSTSRIRQGPFTNAELTTLTGEEEEQTAEIELTTTATTTTTETVYGESRATEYVSGETAESVFGFSVTTNE